MRAKCDFLPFRPQFNRALTIELVLVIFMYLWLKKAQHFSGMCMGAYPISSHSITGTFFLFLSIQLLLLYAILSRLELKAVGFVPRGNIFETAEWGGAVKRRWDFAPTFSRLIKKAKTQPANFFFIFYFALFLLLLLLLLSFSSSAGWKEGGKETSRPCREELAPCCIIGMPARPSPV